MSNAAKNRTGPALVLTIVAVCCLPMPAFSDELQYLPDNVRVITSVDLTAAAKTKTYQKVVKMVLSLDPALGGKVDKEREEWLGKYLGKIARVTSATGMPEQEGKADTGRNVEDVEILTAINAISAAEYKALKKPHPYQKNYAFKEIKHGAVTIYQETYQFQFNKDAKLGDVVEGEAFYVADGKYVVSSRQVPILKKIIDRNKPTSPGLSSTMQTGLKEAGFGNAMNVVVDIKNMTAKQKNDLHRMFAGLAADGDFKANIDKVQLLTIKVNEPNGKLKLTATLTCNDAAGAVAVKAVGERTLANLKTKMNMDPKEPLSAELQKFLTGVRTAVNAIQVSSADSTVIVSLEAEPEIAAHAALGLGWLFTVKTATTEGGHPKKPTESLQPPPKPLSLEDQAKAVAEQFTTSLFMKGEVDSAMNLVAVPYFHTNGEPGDRKPQVFTKLDDVRKQFAKFMGQQAINPDLAVKEVSVITYEKFLAKEKDMSAEVRTALDEVMKKTDCIVVTRLAGGGSFGQITTLVSWRDGQPKVVGYTVAFQR